MIGAVWDARGTEEIARALKGVDCDLDILQRRRPWDAVVCERHGKLQYHSQQFYLAGMIGGLNSLTRYRKHTVLP